LEVAQTGIEYLREVIGVFGWLTFRLPNWIYFVVIANLILAICSSGTKLHPTIYFRFFCLGVAIVGLLLTAITVYMGWNAVAAVRIEGWQGRYAIPFLPLVTLGLSNGFLRKRRGIYEWIWAVSIITSIAAIVLLGCATYL
jgi:uncharacterized membrane protein